MRLEVFDEDYIPQRILFRDKQIERVALNMLPAEQGSRPINTLCLGSPATGKTTVIKFVLSQLQFSVPVYLNCQVSRTKQQIFLKIFERIFGYAPHRGVSFQKIMDGVFSKIDRPLVVVLDDANFVDDSVIEETILTLLKAHEVKEGVKIGVFLVATDLKYLYRFSDELLSIFHPDEVHFPPYDRDEMRAILLDRVRVGLDIEFEDEAFELIVEEAFKYGDIRYGLSLVKHSALISWREGKEKIDVESVEKAKGLGKTAFYRKILLALDEKELAVLKTIYSTGVKKAIEIFSEVEGLSYSKYLEILKKLENLRLIDVVTKYERGLSSIIVRRFEAEEILKAIEERERHP